MDGPLNCDGKVVGGAIGLSIGGYVLGFLSHCSCKDALSKQIPPAGSGGGFSSHFETGESEPLQRMHFQIGAPSSRG